MLATSPRKRGGVKTERIGHADPISPELSDKCRDRYQVSRMPSSAPSVERNSPPGIAELRTAAAVRERCAMVYRWVADGRSPRERILDEPFPKSEG